MNLNYLDFEFSEDTEGVGLFDAMASVKPQQLASVHDEIAQVLRWAFEAFGDTRGAVEDGADWDFDLQSQQDVTMTESIDFDPASGRVQVAGQTVGVPRHTLTLSLSGSPAFCQAFRQVFLNE